MLSTSYHVIFLRHIFCVVLTYRQVFENFLRDVLDAYMSKTGPIYETVAGSKSPEDLDRTVRTTFSVAAKSEFPSMSAIDKAIRNSKYVQAAVWKQFGFEENLEYPYLSYDLLYGTLSAAVHIKVIDDLLVSDLADDRYKKFLQALGKRFSKRVVEYSEMDASTFEDEEKGKQAIGDVNGDKKES